MNAPLAYDPQAPLGSSRNPFTATMLERYCFDGYRPAGFEWANTIAGSATHDVLAAEARGETLSWDEAWERRAKGVPIRYAEGERHSDIRAEHVEMLALFVRPWLVEPKPVIHGVELAFRLNLEGMWFAGTIDLLMKRHELAIIDYKSGVAEPDSALGVQAHLYPLAVLDGEFSLTAKRRGDGYDWTGADWHPFAERQRPEFWYVWLRDLPVQARHNERNAAKYAKWQAKEAARKRGKQKPFEPNQPRIPRSMIRGGSSTAASSRLYLAILVERMLRIVRRESRASEYELAREF